MVPIIAKLNVILCSEYVSTLEFRHSLKKAKEDDDFFIKEHLCSAITHLTLKISQFSLPAKTALKLL